MYVKVHIQAVREGRLTSKCCSPQTEAETNYRFGAPERRTVAVDDDDGGGDGAAESAASEKRQSRLPPTGC